jgi:hypothetical protein
VRAYASSCLASELPLLISSARFCSSESFRTPYLLASAFDSRNEPGSDTDTARALLASRLPLWLCSQIPLPPHSSHCAFRLLCWQIPMPPQSLHRAFCLLCWQISLPPHSKTHSLHLPFRLLCWHNPMPPHSLHLDVCLLCGHFLLGLRDFGGTRWVLRGIIDGGGC